MTIAQSLKSISAYPIPSATLQDIAEGEGLTIDAEVTPEARRSRSFRKAKAAVLMWLSGAPNVSQGGQSYSFSEDERKHFRNQAAAILDELGETGAAVVFGYQGEDL